MIFQQRTNSTMSIAQLIEPALMSFYIKSDAELPGMNSIKTEDRQRVSVPSDKSRPSISSLANERGGHKLAAELNVDGIASSVNGQAGGLEVAA